MNTKPVTDIQRFIDTYASVGIRLDAQPGKNEWPECQYLKLEVGDKHVDGYSGFVTMIWFDADGKFIEQRILE